MKVKFHKPTWCLEQYTTCGFTGTTKTRAVQVDDTEFEIMGIDRQKRYVNMWVESDGCIDGYKSWLINVPSVLFEEIE